MLPKYSIIIPTRNGLKYLKFAVESVLQQSEIDFELIVSDNHSSDGTWDYINTIKDNRLICIQPPIALSMVNHFEFALQKPKGEWISVFGDDDGLQPYFFELANVLTNKFANYEVICGKRSYYFWKGCETVYGKLIVHYHANANILSLFTKTQLRKLLFGNTLFYFSEPQFYTGTLFRKSLLDKIKFRQGGRLFTSINLDANCVAIILKHTDKYIYSNIPLCWVGSSPKSTGFNGLKKEEAAQNSKDDFIKLNTEDSLKINVRFKNALSLMDMQVFFLESLIQSNILYTNWYFKLIDTKLFRHFIFFKVYKNFLVSNKSTPEKSKYYLELFKDNGVNIIGLKFLKIIYSIVAAIAYLGTWISIKLSNTPKVNFSEIVIESESQEEFPTILEASAAALKEYKKLTLHF